MTLRRTLLILAPLPLLVAALWLWSRAHRSHEITSLSITSLGLRMDPSTHVTGFTIAGRGATGVCAMFAVTNIGKDAIWFDTSTVELKTAVGWQRTTPNLTAWSGIESDGMNSLWPPGKGCLYAVGWPPDISTNAVWRLRIQYGKAPSRFAQALSDKFDLDFFTRRKAEQIISTAEIQR
jgi:hypothetical protein